MDENKEKVDISDVAKESPESKESPFGKGIEAALYIIYDRNNDRYGLIAAPGFLEWPEKAYYALKCAEKNLDEYYFKKKTFRENITKGVRNFQDKMNFRKFWGKK